MQYVTSYDVLEKIDDLLEQRIAFTLVANVNEGSEVFKRDNLVEYLGDEELENVIKDFKSLDNFEKYNENYLFSWIELEVTGVYCGFGIGSKYLKGSEYLVADYYSKSHEEDMACEILFRKVDVEKISKEEYALLKEVTAVTSFLCNFIKSY